MLKRYTFWLWTAVIFQLLTAFFHSLSLFITPVPNNETQRQMMELMDTYKMDLGGGFHPTFGNLFIALSSCFSLLCLLGGLINAYLLKKKAPHDLIGGILLINILVFGVCFAMMAIFTFLPPIILSGLIFVSLVLSYLFVRSSKQNKIV
jgi:hypothetical protein